MKLLITCIISMFMFVGFANASCEDVTNPLTVSGLVSELPDVCEAYDRAYQFFKDHGFTPKRELSISSTDAFFGLMANGDLVQSYANYNALSNKITITHFSSLYTKERTTWLLDPQDMNSGLEITKEDWVSILTHEIAHSMFQELWENKNPVMLQNGMYIPKGIHEYVAYTVQLATMNPTHREKVLSQYDAKPFPYIERLNSFIHYFHPHKYGVRSFLTHQENGGQWIKDFVNGKFVYGGPDL